ncbi:hypothetical protein BH18THE2_BH18THE2_09800 [soil metagenome]
MILFFLITSILTTTWFLTLPASYSDSLMGGVLSQRIGNLDVELKTDPAKPLVAQRTSLFVRIGSTNGQDVIDTPIAIKLTKQGEEIHRSKIIFVPNGHYTYSYNFTDPGIYGIDIHIQDFDATTATEPSFSRGEGVVFTFPLNVQAKSFFGLPDLEITLIITAVVAGVSGSVLFSLKRKRDRRKTSYQPSGKN